MHLHIAHYRIRLDNDLDQIMRQNFGTAAKRGSLRQARPSTHVHRPSTREYRPSRSARLGVAVEAMGVSSRCASTRTPERLLRA